MFDDLASHKGPPLRLRLETLQRRMLVGLEASVVNLVGHRVWDEILSADLRGVGFLELVFV